MRTERRPRRVKNNLFKVTCFVIILKKIIIIKTIGERYCYDIIVTNDIYDDRRSTRRHSEYNDFIKVLVRTENIIIGRRRCRYVRAGQVWNAVGLRYCTTAASLVGDVSPGTSAPFSSCSDARTPPDGGSICRRFDRASGASGACGRVWRVCFCGCVHTSACVCV